MSTSRDNRSSKCVSAFTRYANIIGQVGGFDTPQDKKKTVYLPEKKNLQKFTKVKYHTPKQAGKVRRKQEQANQYFQSYLGV